MNIDNIEIAIVCLGVSFLLLIAAVVVVYHYTSTNIYLINQQNIALRQYIELVAKYAGLTDDKDK